MTEPQPTQAAREAAASIVNSRSLQDGFRIGREDRHVFVQAFARHADEREAQVIAGVVAWLREPARKAFIPMPDSVIPAHMDTDDYGNEIGWRSEQRRKISRLPTAKDFADAIERGDWKGPRND